MDVTRVREELGWSPRHDAGDGAARAPRRPARRRAGAGTPPLDPGAGGPGRIREFLTGIGGRNG